MRMFRIRIHNAGTPVAVALLALCLAAPPARAGAAAPEAVTAAEAEASGSDVTTVVSEANTTAGPAVSPTGANQYGTSAEDIAAAPKGKSASITDVLAQMPG